MISKYFSKISSLARSMREYSAAVATRFPFSYPVGAHQQARFGMYDVLSSPLTSFLAFRCHRSSFVRADHDLMLVSNSARSQTHGSLHPNQITNHCCTASIKRSSSIFLLPSTLLLRTWMLHILICRPLSVRRLRAEAWVAVWVADASGTEEEERTRSRGI